MEILNRVRKQLEKNIDPKYKEGAMRYFKEPITILGVRSPDVRRISRETYADIKTMPKNKLFALCENLLKTPYGEENIIAFDWVFRRKKEFQKSDFKTFEFWIRKYVTNWGTCDDFCTHTMGHYLLMHPESISKLETWAKSDNRWFRRAAAVSLIPAARTNVHLDHIFNIAAILLRDSDDLVQKGYGWMLKETCKSDEKRVFDYVMSEKHRMPRTALRYAIENMPKDLKRKAMAKE